MGEKVVTIMVIKVDLACEKCRRKIKKVLCKIPQIQSQEYDEKTNTVTITVVCCSPEKVKQKICCKGGETVKGIEIKKVTEKPKKDPPKAPEPAPAPAPPKAPEPAPPPFHGCLPPPMPAFPRTCCTECYQGQGGGPCYSAPCYYQWHGRLVYDSWGGGGGCRSGWYVSRCDYLSEENPSGCTVM